MSQRCTKETYSSEKRWNQGVEKVHLLRMDGEYVLRYGCGNFVENKIIAGGIW